MTQEIPQEMKAAVLHGWNDLRYGEFETPPFGPEEVLCRVKACGICGTDVHIMKGHFKGVFPPQFPFILGHEWYGEIAALGSRGGWYWPELRAARGFSWIPIVSRWMKLT
jgi:D-arabinose 1-dehydrogenase-like Zn-dependent alcohol dehydrogenase